MTVPKQSPAKKIIVIVVEDEALIRMTAVEIFCEAGFEVLQAENAEAAIAILETEASRLHVMFTDVHMQGKMTGVHLVQHARKYWPWLGLLLTSGRPKPAAGDLPDGCRFIGKPYDIGHVLQHVRELAAAA